jgi:ATP-binding cassette, subfamily B, multidrug efflux pump
MGRGGPGAVMAAIEKPKDFNKSIKTLLGYLKPYRISVAIVIIFAIASTVFAIVGPKILGEMTNTIVYGYGSGQAYDRVVEGLPPGVSIPPGTTGEQVLEQMPASIRDTLTADQQDQLRTIDFSHRPGIDFDRISRLGLILLTLYAFSAAFAYIQGYVMAGVAQRVTFKLRQDLANKIDRMPLKYFDTKTHGEVLSRFTNDVETVSQTLSQGMSQMITAVVTLVGILIMMLTISWQMTLVAVLILPISFGLIRLVIGKSQKYFKDQQKTLGNLNGHVEEMFSGHMVMRVFGGEKASVAKFRVINTELHESAWKSQFYSGLMMPIMTFVSNIGYVAVAVLGGWLALNGTVRIGDIQAFFQYLSQFTQPIAQVASVANVLQSTAAAAERVFEFLDEEEESAEPAITPKLELETVQGAVDFNHVTFGYDADKPIIRDFNVSIAPGQRVAIVGPTGAGKTTIVNLLMRFYELDSGAITVDGIDIRDMKRSDVRALFTMVLQDTWLFRGTIAENIAYARDSATHEQVVAAAEAAHADHFIRALPGGYEMELNEAADNISQGEKQLLTIARAMLGDSPILILDEATSSVDTRTEVLIQRGMERLMEGRTSFVIAHRLSTIRNADLILVMRDGNIVEQGTHDELIAQNGFYAELYSSQFDEVAA